METSAPLWVVLAVMCIGSGEGLNSRAEESAFACDDCDDHVVHLRDIIEKFSDAEVVVLRQGIELLLAVDGDDCGPAIVGSGELDLLVELSFCDHVECSVYDWSSFH